MHGGGGHAWMGRHRKPAALADELAGSCYSAQRRHGGGLQSLGGAVVLLAEREALSEMGNHRIILVRNSIAEQLGVHGVSTGYLGWD